MRFPAYVPAAVRVHIEKLIDGDDHGFNGWAKASKSPGSAWIPEVVAFLRRFQKQDERIKKMFQHLNAAGLSESSQKQFVNAAWLAWTDYRKYRAQIERADQQRKAIAKHAEELAKLLRTTTENGLMGLPMEFYSVRTLLRETDGDDILWPLMREKLLPISGDREASDLDYIWGIAPNLPDILDTVAMAANAYQPQFGGRTGAAIAKQENNTKTEYIRALWHELGRTPGLDKASRHLMHAVGCVTTAAINRNGITADYEAVKQAIGLKKPRKKKVTPPSFIRKVTF